MQIPTFFTVPSRRPLTRPSVHFGQGESVPSVDLVKEHMSQLLELPIRNTFLHILDETVIGDGHIRLDEDKVWHTVFENQLQILRQVREQSTLWQFEFLNHLIETLESMQKVYSASPLPPKQQLHAHAIALLKAAGRY